MYQRQGETSQNKTEMLTGSQLHEEHGRAVLSASLLRSLAYGLLLFALILVTVYWLNLFFS